MRRDEKAKKARKERLLERLLRERAQIVAGTLSRRFRDHVGAGDMTQQDALVADLKRQDARITEARVGL